MKIILLFVGLSIVNVIFSTFRSIATIKYGKYLASFINAGYWSFYTIVLIYSVAEFSLIAKMIITFACNLFGVFVVKLIEEKTAKPKAWKIEVITDIDNSNVIQAELNKNNFDFVITEIFDEKDKIEIFSYSKDESEKIKNILNNFEAIKYFVVESKTL